MKKTLFTLLVFITLSVMSYAQNTILEARGMAIGSVVTVKGIVTNGAELGVIRYFQDNTAGIAAYGSLVSPVLRGDSVTITGTLKNYNQLLELDPVSEIIVRSSGNALPAPIVLTPAQLNETYEGMLVQIQNATFADAGSVFAQKKYAFTANNETGYIYVKSSQTDIVGQPIPSGPVNLTAILSQFDYTDPSAGYQMLPRTISDIQMADPLYLTSVLYNTSFTKTEIGFSWTTNVASTTEMYYGSTPELVKTNKIAGTGGSVDHAISISGLTAGSVTWVQAFSVSGNDSAFSGVLPFTTISNSTGDMKVYFNTGVDTEYSKGVDAINVGTTLDDTLINYINRAKSSIDFTMYNFNNEGISNVSDALKAAANRGVTVRVIGCGTTANLGMDELAGSAVNVLIGPSETERTGIMHNKFILFDTESANANEPLVWTGSTNLTDGQVNLDANQVIIVQDQSLARAYKIEFEEMWGSSGNTANKTNARFGNTKKNNTPHEFLINGKRVECYFSPTDGVNAKIVNTINTTDNDLSIATMLITRTEMANAIAAQKTEGAAVNMITNAEGNNNTTVNEILKASLGTHYTFDTESSGIMHHKYMVVDQDAPENDPLVFTGSHNWSAAADNDNDENTIIIHDATLANIYYQNFVYRFVENNGVLSELDGPPTAVNDTVETEAGQPILVEVLENDVKQSAVTVIIEIPAKNGDAYIPWSNPNVIGYIPNPDFIGKDTITYKIEYQAEPALFSIAKIFIDVTKPSSAPTAVNDSIITPMDQVATIAAISNDIRQAPVTLSIETSPKNGSAYIPSYDKSLIKYLPNTGFHGIDSIIYKIAYQSDPTLYSSALIYLTVTNPNNINTSEINGYMMVSPNPVKNNSLSISCFMNTASNGKIQMMDITGKLIFENRVSLTAGDNRLTYELPNNHQGIYFIRLTTPNSEWNQKVIIE